MGRLVIGMFSDGTFSDGTFSDGTFSNGTFCMWIIFWTCIALNIIVKLSYFVLLFGKFSSAEVFSVWGIVHISFTQVKAALNMTVSRDLSEQFRENLIFRNV